MFLCEYRVCKKFAEEMKTNCQDQCFVFIFDTLSSFYFLFSFLVKFEIWCFVMLVFSLAPLIVFVCVSGLSAVGKKECGTEIQCLQRRARGQGGVANLFPVAERVGRWLFNFIYLSI